MAADGWQMARMAGAFLVAMLLAFAPARAADDRNTLQLQRLGPFRMQIVDPVWGHQMLFARFQVLTDDVPHQLQMLSDESRLKILNGLRQALADYTTKDFQGGGGAELLRDIMSDRVLKPIGIPVQQIYVVEMVIAPRN